MDGDHVQKEIDQANTRRNNRFNSNMSGAAGMRCLTPAVVDQQQIIRRDFKDHYERARSSSQRGNTGFVNNLTTVMEERRAQSPVKSQLQVIPEVTRQQVHAVAAGTPSVKFSPSKKDINLDSNAPVYGEISSEQTKQISAITYQNYRATQDVHKSGRGAKASLYTDDYKYNTIEIPRDQRQFNSHKRNLDGELTNIIKYQQQQPYETLNPERESYRPSEAVTPFNEKATPEMPTSSVLLSPKVIESVR